MGNKVNSLGAALLVISVSCMLASIFIFSFVYSINPTGSLFDKLKFSQLFMTEQGKVVPRLIEELRIFSTVAIGGFCVSAIFYSLRLMGKSFKGMTLLFIFSTVIGIGTFFALRLILAEMISQDAAFGVSWYFAFGAFIPLVIGYFYRNKKT